MNFTHILLNKTTTQSATTWHSYSGSSHSQPFRSVESVSQNRLTKCDEYFIRKEGAWQYTVLGFLRFKGHLGPQAKILPTICTIIVRYNVISDISRSTENSRNFETFRKLDNFRKFLQLQN